MIGNHEKNLECIRIIEHSASNQSDRGHICPYILIIEELHVYMPDCKLHLNERKFLSICIKIKPNTLKIYKGHQFHCLVYEIVRNGKKFYEKLKFI